MIEDLIYEFTKYLHDYENPYDYVDDDEMLRKLIRSWLEQKV